MDFHKAIKAVGTGKKHNRELRYEEMYRVTEMILQREVYPEQISAFLLGWRVRVESSEEFRAMLACFDRFITKSPVADAIELGYPYDGKVDNPYLFPLIADYLVKSGLQLVVTGDHLQPSKGGTTVKEVCKNLKLPENCRYFDRADHFPHLSDLTQIRSRLGLRTGINTVEKLHNIAQADYALIGVFHKPFVKKYAAIFGDRYKRLVIVQGNEGTPEIYSRCKYWICEEGEVREYYVDPAKFGITYEKSWKPISTARSLEMVQNPSDGLQQLAKLNAAFYLFITGRAVTLEEGWEQLD
jgi:anthranilate phosphoribosyltransferase